MRSGTLTLGYLPKHPDCRMAKRMKHSYEAGPHHRICFMTLLFTVIAGIFGFIFGGLYGGLSAMFITFLVMWLLGLVLMIFIGKATK